MIEKALRYELETAAPNLKGKIYHINAPESAKSPYLVYMRTRTDKVKTLDGFTDHQALSFMFSVMAPKYADMVSLREQIEALLMSFPKTSIGADGTYIEDIEIDNITEQYEYQLKVYRGIIDFTIYF